MAKVRAKDRNQSVIAKRVEAKIQRASELNRTLSVLVYSYPKKGKTRFCATAEDVLIIDVDEKGTGSTKETDPNVFPVKVWDDFDDVYWYLKNGKHDFKTWAIDGVTGMQTLGMNFLLGESVALDASRDPAMPRGPLWQKLSVLMKRQITNFRNLDDMNGIFTALAKTRSGGDDDDESGDMAETMVLPMVMPSVAGHLEAAVDVIGFLRPIEVKVRVKGGKKDKVTTVKRTRMRVDNNPRYITGDRTHCFGEYLDAPDFSKMLSLYNGQEV